MDERKILREAIAIYRFDVQVNRVNNADKIERLIDRYINELDDGQEVTNSWLLSNPTFFYAAVMSYRAYVKSAIDDEWENDPNYEKDRQVLDYLNGVAILLKQNIKL